jgi:hypothetical protein
MPAALNAFNTNDFVKVFIQAGQNSEKKSALSTGSHPSLLWLWISSSVE